MFRAGDRQVAFARDLVGVGGRERLRLQRVGRRVENHVLILLDRRAIAAVVGNVVGNDDFRAVVDERTTHGNLGKQTVLDVCLLGVEGTDHAVIVVRLIVRLIRLDVVEQGRVIDGRLVERFRDDAVVIAGAQGMGIPGKHLDCLIHAPVESAVGRCGCLCRPFSACSPAGWWRIRSRPYLSWQRLHCPGRGPSFHSLSRT